MLLQLAAAITLHQAAQTCDPAQFKQLLAKQPALSELDEKGFTPLHIAVDSRKPACVALLLEVGADMSKPDRKSRTAFNPFVNIPNPQERVAMAKIFFALTSQ